MKNLFKWFYAWLFEPQMEVSKPVNMMRLSPTLRTDEDVGMETIYYRDGSILKECELVCLNRAIGNETRPAHKSIGQLFPSYQPDRSQHETSSGDMWSYYPPSEDTSAIEKLAKQHQYHSFGEWSQAVEEGRFYEKEPEVPKRSGLFYRVFMWLIH